MIHFLVEIFKITFNTASGRKMTKTNFIFSGVIIAWLE